MGVIAYALRPALGTVVSRLLILLRTGRGRRGLVSIYQRCRCSPQHGFRGRSPFSPRTGRLNSSWPAFIPIEGTHGLCDRSGAPLFPRVYLFRHALSRSSVPVISMSLLSFRSVLSASAGAKAFG